MIVSWVGDMLVVGSKQSLDHLSNMLQDRIYSEDLGDLQEYLGLKLDRNEDELDITQPVLVKSFNDEFKLDGIKSRGTPEESGQVLFKSEADDLLKSEKKKDRRGVGKLLHMMRFSPPENVNATRELSKFMTSDTSKVHMKEMLEEMKYVVSTTQRG